MKTFCTPVLLLAGVMGLAPLAASAQAPAAAAPCEPQSAGTITYDEIVAKYADADSKFVVLEGADGIRVHYKDQGAGPAILLVHSSVGDLKDWDGWVKVLSKSYRVIRLDLPAFGLTGPVPSGNYSIDRYLMLVDSLMDHLGIERFAIAGTSYGGLVAFRYAGTRVDRVAALVLSNSAGVEYGGRGGTSERARNPAAVFTPRVTTTEMTAKMLNSIINDPSKVTPEIVQRKTDYANVVGRDREAFVATRMYERGNPQRVLSHVRAPALVLWGATSKALSADTAQAFVDAMKNARSTQKILYDGGGHLLHIERPEQTVADVKPFLDRQVTGGAWQ
ncbi:MAG: alpha/beta hydrolase [Gammaproteobacteria bacterium]|nr:alpha/beta hydrolase [Gammaproteobacteria bacterium]